MPVRAPKGLAPKQFHKVGTERKFIKVTDIKSSELPLINALTAIVLIYDYDQNYNASKMLSRVFSLKSEGTMLTKKASLSWVEEKEHSPSTASSGSSISSLPTEGTFLNILYTPTLAVPSPGVTFNMIWVESRAP